MAKILYLFLLSFIFLFNNGGAQTASAAKEPVLTYNLFQNYPNPFNPSTMIKFTVPEAAYVSLKVFNALGSEVAVLVDSNKEAGTYEVNFNGEALPSGIYFLQLKAGSYTNIKKMILLK